MNDLGLKLNSLLSSKPNVQQPIDPFQTCRKQQVFKPCDRLSALAAIGEERPLHGTGEGDEEGIDLFLPSGRKAPPSLRIETEEDHGVELESLTFVDRHKRYLADAFEAIKSVRPDIHSFSAFAKQRDEPCPYPFEVRVPPIGGKGLSQPIGTDKFKSDMKDQGRALVCRFVVTHGRTQSGSKFLNALLQPLLRLLIIRVDGE